MLERVPLGSPGSFALPKSVGDSVVGRSCDRNTMRSFLGQHGVNWGEGEDEGGGGGGGGGYEGGGHEGGGYGGGY